MIDHMLQREPGIHIAYSTLGQGPAVMLVHGFLSTAHINWIKYGVASKLAEAGFRVILPDLRAHGRSSVPEDAASYPADILAQDMEAVMADAAPDGCDLVGYSLGARTVMRMVLRGAKPGKLVISGMGLAGLTDSSVRQAFFISAIAARDTLQRGDAGYEVARFLTSTGTNPVAAAHVLRSQVDSSAAELTKVTMPTLVIAGDTDSDNGSAIDLCAALPNARYSEIKGDHMSAIVNPEFGTQIAAFLSE
jgi:pimeloyl-ACP methyl ester carboxylesterase